MKHLVRWRTIPGIVVASLILLASVSGCSDSQAWLKTYKVKGKVLVDGQPVKDVILKFHPKKQDPARPLLPTGQTNEQGEFTLSSFAKGDGAPAGEYDVTAIWSKGKNPISTLWEGDKLNGHYATKEKAGIHITIEEKDQEAPPLELSTKGLKKK